MCEQARGNLKDFSSQKKQLEDYISQMSDWLKSMEESLISTTTGSDPEDIYSVKVSRVFIVMNERVYSTICIFTTTNLCLYLHQCLNIKHFPQ